MRSAVALSLILPLAILACDDDSRQRPDAVTERHDNGALRLDERQLSASLVGGDVRATVWLDAVDGPVRGTVAVELRRIGEGKRFGSASADVAVDSRASVSLDLGALPDGVEGVDLALYALEYRVKTEGEPDIFGTRSLWTAVPKVEAQVIGPDTYDVDVESTLRVIARDPGSGAALANAPVRVLLEREGGEDGSDAVSRLLHEGVTDATGQIVVPIQPEDGDAGEGTIVVEIDGGEAGAAAVRSPVRVGRSRRVLLTTDKPLYQPGQVMHLRTLVMGRGDRSAQADAELVFEVADSKGNKVFKKATTTDGFGIASADFQLGREVNMGRYTIRAAMGEDISEKTVTVDRYVLPRFAVAATLDRAYYRPGDTIQGTIRGTYTFGEPVRNGTVVVRAQTVDVSLNTFAEITGQTNEQGIYAFEVVIPDFLVGQDLAQGAGIVQIDVILTDTAEHEQSTTVTTRVAEGDLRITVVPESGELVPGVANKLYIQTTDPAGGPARAELVVEADGNRIETTTGDDGFGAVLLPVAGASLALTITANTGDGASVVKDVTLQAGSTDGGLLLRTDKALYNVGETLTVEVRAPEDADRLYLDAIRSGRTVLTSIVDVTDGVGTVELDLGDDLAGSLSLSAYYLTDTSKVLRDTRVVYVDAGAGLQVTVEADRDLYAPGEPARVLLNVSDADGGPVAAALGLQIVDEAVFALTEMRPGLAETFFAIEEAITAPRVSVEGWGVHRIIAPADDQEDRAHAAEMVFAATDGFVAPIDRNTYREATRDLPGRLTPELQAFLAPFVQQLESLIELQVVTNETLEAYLTSAGRDVADPWGQPLRIELVNGWQIMATSAGPDELVDSPDDMTVELTSANLNRNRGGFGGGGMDDDMDGAFADGDGMPEAGGMPPAPAPNAEEPQDPGADEDNGGNADGGSPTRVRRFFPETLLSQPSIITDGDGHAELEITMADSITTWRASAMANTVDGRIGSNVGSLRVFQDFFIEPDVPATLTRGDEFSLPVAVFNYLDRAQQVEVRLLDAEGFSVDGSDSQVLVLEAGEVLATHFRLRAENVGFASVTVWGRGETLEDAVERIVEIVPDGKEQLTSPSGRLEGTVTARCGAPVEAVPGSGRCVAKVYPGVLSQVVEGLDSMLRQPTGCFEQSTASTWPNVMVTNYVRETDQVTPEIDAKARAFVNEGYQKILTFESKTESGGFNWWGNEEPGNIVLTAAAMQMLHDMKPILDVDTAVIERAHRWMEGKQQNDGTWDFRSSTHSDIQNLTQDATRATAFVVWSMATTGYVGAAQARGLDYLRAQLDAEDDAYTLGVVANAFVAADPRSPTVDALLARLNDLRKEDGELVYWQADGSSATGSYGGNADVETTALIVLAMIGQGSYPASTSAALNWLATKKDGFGNYGSTQATVLSLRAMLGSLGAEPEAADATIDIAVDGNVVQTVTVDASNSDVMQVFDLREVAGAGDHEVSLTINGSGNLFYQVISAWHVPWNTIDEPPAGPMTVNVDYDRTDLEVDGVVTGTVTVTNSDADLADNVMVEVGLPPGFDLDSTPLVAAVADGRLTRFENRGRLLVGYMSDVLPGEPRVFSYKLVARTPLRAEIPRARVWSYYNPEVEAFDEPVAVVVR